MNINVVDNKQEKANCSGTDFKNYIEPFDPAVRNYKSGCLSKELRRNIVFVF